MNTKKLLLTAGLVALAGAAQAVPNDTSKASLLVFPDIEAPVGRTTLVQISNFGSVWAHIQCYYQTADKVRGQFDFTMSPKETRVFDVKTGDGVPAGVGAQFPPFGGLPKGELICLVVESQDGNGDDVYGPIDYDGTLTSQSGIIGVARVVQYNAPGWITEYQAWTMRANAGAPFTLNEDGTATVTFGPTGTYEACARTLIANILTRNSYGNAARGYVGYDTDQDTWNLGDPNVLPQDIGTMVVDANHLFVAVCAQALQEGAPLLYTKLLMAGRDEDENSFSADQCGDSWYDVNLGDPTADPVNVPWGPRTGWTAFLNIGERWAESFQLNLASRTLANSTCGCGGVACDPILCPDGNTRPYTVGCPLDGVPPYRQHPGSSNQGAGLWATQVIEAYQSPANDQDAAASNLFAWRNSTVNNFITIELEPAKK